MSDTPANRWNSTIVSCRKKCQAILGTSQDIRYAGAINTYGRTLAGIVRPGIKPVLKYEHAQNEFFVIPTLISMRSNASKSLGKLQYVLFQHNKIPVIAMQKDKITYYVSLDKKIPNVEQLVSKLQKII